MHAKTWDVHIHISEEGDLTRARAVLLSDARPPLETSGTARRNPVDRSVPEIGDELATARALSGLAHALLDVTAHDIESAQNERGIHLPV